MDIGASFVIFFLFLLGSYSWRIWEVCYLNSRNYTCVAKSIWSKFCVFEHKQFSSYFFSTVKRSHMWEIVLKYVGQWLIWPDTFGLMEIPQNWLAATMRTILRQKCALPCGKMRTTLRQKCAPSCGKNAHHLAAKMRTTLRQKCAPPCGKNAHHLSAKMCTTLRQNRTNLAATNDAISTFFWQLVGRYWFN